MKKSASTRSKADNLPLQPLEPHLEASTSRDYISIENFDRQSTRVHFTDPSTVEALRRLGLKSSDFNFKPLKVFKKPGLDHSLIQLLYEKNEQEREKMIKEVVKMRNKVIQEQDLPHPIPALVRREQLFIQDQKLHIQKIEKDGQCTLRRLALRSLRETYLQNERAIQSANTKARMMQLTTLKEEQLYNAKKYAATTPITPRRPSSEKEGINPREIYESYQQHIARAEEIRMKFHDQVREAAREKQRLQQEAKERSKKLAEEQVQKKAQSVEQINNRFSGWLESREAVIQEQEQKKKEHENKLKTAVELANKYEHNRRENVKTKIKESDIKSSQAIEQHEMNIREKIRRRRQLIEQRAQQAHETKETLYKEIEQTKRKEIEKNESSAQHRLQEMEYQNKLSIYDSKFEREVRAMNARRKIAADDYQRQLKIKANVEDTSQVDQVIQESQLVTEQKFGTMTKYQRQRETLLQEFKRLKGPDDKEGLKRVQAILRLDDAQFQELLSIATDQEIASPSSSRRKSRASEKI